MNSKEPYGQVCSKSWQAGGQPARDFLSGADLGERDEGGWIEIQCECFVVSVEFLSGRHS